MKYIQLASCKSVLLTFCLALALNCLNCYSKETEFSVNFRDAKVTTMTSFGGIELSLSSQPSYSNKSDTIRPEISLFTSRAPSKALDFTRTKLFERSTPQKSNRYKNTIPAIYRITLKGYSIMEYSNYQTSTWSLDKVGLRELRKPQIMFSIEKRIN
ncbi:hypothetical protein [Aliikangiella sp. G2MR2-5]|uniref:hypothetical protein n=1 Tax=Aliikangiella sp. G2MR2-5 TaxID=2788943 RepID=UPI0018AA3852|nr:hypothetical protein [Aliikangiella sp. G2MR2-5]